MTKETALREAQVEANNRDMVLVVTHNPYGDKVDAENYGYIPEHALDIFKHETVVATILPKKGKT